MDRIAGRMGTKAPVALRVNPDVDPRTHPYISTGMKKNKFGINFQKSLEEYRLAKTLPNVEVIGVSCHIGSQLTDVDPFVEAVQRIKELVQKLRAAGMTIRYLDMGEGWGLPIKRKSPLIPWSMPRRCYMS